LDYVVIDRLLFMAVVVVMMMMMMMMMIGREWLVIDVLVCICEVSSQTPLGDTMPQ
jgi:hypothetical protein